MSDRHPKSRRSIYHGVKVRSRVRSKRRGRTRGALVKRRRSSRVTWWEWSERLKAWQKQ